MKFLSRTGVSDVMHIIFEHAHQDMYLLDGAAKPPTLDMSGVGGAVVRPP